MNQAVESQLMPVFGTRKTISLEEGVDRMARWAKQHGPGKRCHSPGLNSNVNSRRRGGLDRCATWHRS
jgi:hypothetical protein